MRHAGGEVRTDVGHIAGLAEMYLHGHEIIFDREVGYPGPSAQSLEFVEKVGIRICPEIREIYF